MGRTTSSPAASRERARCPGPWATLRTNGMSPRSRFAPPGVSITDIGTVSSFQSMAWCSKKTESAASSASSATGTMSPSTWTVLDPKWICVWSLRRGAWRQPASLTRSRWSSGAPQRSQLGASGRLWAWHHWHSTRCPVSVTVTVTCSPKAFCAIAHRGLRPPQWSGPSVPQFGARPPHRGAVIPAHPDTTAPGHAVSRPRGHPRPMSAGLHVASSLVTLTLPRTSNIEIASRGREALAGGP